MTETFRFAYSEQPRGIGSKVIVRAFDRADALQRAHEMFDRLDRQQGKRPGEQRTIYFIFKETMDGRPAV